MQKNNLNHATWDCKYHLVFTPKYRKKILFGMLRRQIKDVLHRLAIQKDCKIEEGYLVGAEEPILQTNNSQVDKFLVKKSPAVGIKFGLKNSLGACRKSNFSSNFSQF